jgi:glycosyltransferase involved in cell wall biosynthesis
MSNKLSSISTDETSHKIAIVVPCYKVVKNADDLFARFGPEVHKIYAVDDACPENSGKYIEQNIKDPRIEVIYNKNNLGVGGAVLKGFQRARDDGFDIAVKIDGDGQMDPSLIQNFVRPIEKGMADYTKGNRFYNPSHLKSMPFRRLLGNAILSFVSKFSTGYWDIFDPTNGYIALNLNLLDWVDINKIDQRYFFETDLLFRVGLAKARVIDIPMVAIYEDEQSNLNGFSEAFRFMKGHLRNFSKRILYDYFLRDFSIASLELLIGLISLTFGLLYGLANMHGDTPASAGVVMLAALPFLTGIMLLLSFINYDVRKTPKTPMSNWM